MSTCVHRSTMFGACDRMAWTDEAEFSALFCALPGSKWASGVKAASFGRMEHVGNGSGNHSKSLLASSRIHNRIEESRRVGVPGICEKFTDIGVLDDVAGVHHRS